jgi:two-component sensor histidine kinase
MLALNVLLACVVTALVWSFQPQVPVPGIFWTFVFCLAFTNLFGTPAAWVLARIGVYLERLPQGLQWLLMVVHIVGFTVMGVALGVLLMGQVGLARPENFWHDYASGLRIGIVVALTVGVGFALWEARREELARARREIHERELAEAHVRRQLAEARLASLESRLRPHFLFNTLNSIAALIPENPRLAEDTVERLAALLRFTLEAGERRLVPLSVELEVVTAYLEIERARFGARLRLAVDVAERARAAPVPPLAVQTLVENAVKHAVAARPEPTTVRISARVEDAALLVDVEDDGPGFEAAVLPAGHGLANLRERLSGLFDEGASLEVGRGSAGGARIRLRVPAGEASP